MLTFADVDRYITWKIINGDLQLMNTHKVETLRDMGACCIQRDNYQG